jgi:ABC-type transport system involved in multi-copper enzyme maturation permease subunit
VNHALLVGFWKQRASSLFRVALLAFVVGTPLLVVLFIPQTGLAGLGEITPIILIVVAGAIGQDVSSGVLQLLFARPIRRSEYVLSRWIGASVAAAVLCLLQVAAAAVLLSLRGAAPASSSALLMAGERVLASAGLCAVMILFSSMVGGIGDVGLWLVATVTGAVGGLAGATLKSPWLSRAAEELQRTITPKLELAFLAGSRFSWFETLSYLSTVTLCLALAIVIVNRKELSYASG